MNRERKQEHSRARPHPAWKVRPRQSVLFLTLSLVALSLIFGQLQDPPFETGDDLYGRIYSGWKWFHVYCYRCHGLDALGSGIAPNLRTSIKDLSYAEFLDLTREGRVERGMPSWKPLLDDKQITDVFYYVHARSDKVLPAGRPDEVGEGGGQWTPPSEWVEAVKALDISVEMGGELESQNENKPEAGDSS